MDFVKGSRVVSAALCLRDMRVTEEVQGGQWGRRGGCVESTGKGRKRRHTGRRQRWGAVASCRLFDRPHLSIVPCQVTQEEDWLLKEYIQRAADKFHESIASDAQVMPAVTCLRYANTRAMLLSGDTSLGGCG